MSSRMPPGSSTCEPTRSAACRATSMSTVDGTVSRSTWSKSSVTRCACASRVMTATPPISACAGRSCLSRSARACTNPISSLFAVVESETSSLTPTPAQPTWVESSPSGPQRLERCLARGRERPRAGRPVASGCLEPDPPAALGATGRPALRAPPRQWPPFNPSCWLARVLARRGAGRSHPEHRSPAANPSRPQLGRRRPRQRGCL